MIRLACLLLLCLLAPLTAPLMHAQEGAPAPTLIVPTLVPAVASAAPADSLSSESAVADIIDTGVFRVGILYNAPPYSELTQRGEVSGFNADLLRKIATTWDTQIDFIQVTRLNALEKLNTGEVHTVASAFVHYRDLDTLVDFSQTYLTGRQALMVSAASSHAALQDVADQPIGYVLGTRTEKSLDIWRARISRDLDLRPYLTLDRAVAAVTRGEIAAVVAEEQALLRVAADDLDSVKILDEAVVSESHAFAVRRQDAPMRQLLNKTLQFLAQDGEIDVLFREYFSDATYNADALTIWSGIGEEVSPGQFAGPIRYQSTYALPRVASSGILRVGGLTDAGEAATAGLRRLAELNRAIVAEIAARWGVSLTFVPSNSAGAAELLESGAVDLIVGVKPDWEQAAAMDFSAPYLLHGDRLMVRVNSGIGGFNNLRGRIVGILIGDASAQERAEAWADSINASVRFFRTTESGAARTILEFNNANAIYADSLALLAHLEANPDSLRLTERWYSRSFYTFALPYNDPDFRHLLDYTIQELIVDGTLFRLTAPLLVSDELPAFDLIPGASQFAGINLAAASADVAP